METNQRPVFQTLGDESAGAFCGPEGCNIEAHRQTKETSQRTEKKERHDGKI
ncbi:hypothetical protein [Lactiplantibacillus carotarum]|uniref:hypothetical protein n=1 Tax=Lactiplantibacillus carotarum TaxID=2993456 RepID=UPI00298F317C|nr:hypothetical protein [Lactiplantibacillus carotarum]